ncbi:hypothetical protein ACIRL2_35410 [Embleya sp. NPDC127516]
MRTLLVGYGDHGGDTLLPAACSAGITSPHSSTPTSRARDFVAL